jgi:hypothetical protein
MHAQGTINVSLVVGTVHVYPTWAEANKYAAGAWRHAHLGAAIGIGAAVPPLAAERGVDMSSKPSSSMLKNNLSTA